jgi:hypothetical protein
MKRFFARCPWLGNATWRRIPTAAGACTARWSGGGAWGAGRGFRLGRRSQQGIGVVADDAATATVPQERRAALLANLLPFAVLPVEAQQMLAALLSEEHYAAGRVVVAEGEPGEALYLIVQGQAAVTLRTPSGPVAGTTLGPGELFARSLLVLRLTAPVFAVLLDTYLLARRIWAAAADALLVATVLKAASPFTSLDTAHLARLWWHRCPSGRGRL